MQLIREKEAGNVIAFKFSNKPTNELRNTIVDTFLNSY
jgi:hypothetical protein